MFSIKSFKFFFTWLWNCSVNYCWFHNLCCFKCWAYARKVLVLFVKDDSSSWFKAYYSSTTIWLPVKIQTEVSVLLFVNFCKWTDFVCIIYMLGCSLEERNTITYFAHIVVWNQTSLFVFVFFVCAILFRKKNV